MAKKSLIQKAIDGVDHMINPDQLDQEQHLNLEPIESEKKPSQKITSEGHKKFDKFKNNTGDK